MYRGFMPYSFGKLADKVKGPLIINVSIVEFGNSNITNLR